jgi:hypothetical protein
MLGCVTTCQLVFPRRGSMIHFYGSTCGNYRVVVLVAVFKISALCVHLYEVANLGRHTYSLGV